MMNHIGDISLDRYIPLSLFNIPLNLEKLSQEILQSKKRISTDPLNTHYEDFSFSSTNDNSESKKFLKELHKFAQESNFKITGLWAHIHQHLESTNTHIHAGKNSTFSFVYYVKVPINSGVFIVDFNTSLCYGPRIPITPVEGNFLLFPAWLPHAVTKNLSQDIRISISGNFAPNE